MNRTISLSSPWNRYMSIALSVLVLEVVSFLVLYGLFPQAQLTWYSFTFFLSHFLLMLFWSAKAGSRPEILQEGLAGAGGYLCLLAIIVIASLLRGESPGLSEADGLWLATPFFLSGIVCAALVCIPRQLYQRIILGLCLSPFVMWFCISVPGLILN